MPKINYIIANPPYGEKNLFIGSLDLHFRIVETVLDHYNDKMVVIMPNRICFTNSNNMDKWKEKFTKLSEITNEGNPFDNVNGVNVGIFTFDSKDVESVNVCGKEYKSLFDINPFNEYEYKFMHKLESNFANLYLKDIRLGRPGNTDEKLNKKLSDYVLLCSRENGSMNGKFFSSVIQKVDVMAKQDFIEWNHSYDVFGKCCITMNDEKALINLKKAMNNPLLRFGLHKIQDNRHLSSRVYKYIPEIDWNDDKTQTDVGILEMVGFSQEESNEFAEYCKNYIDKIDE